MKEFLFAVNATAPICLIVLIGYFLKRIGWIPLSLATSLNKLVFRLFLPAMLFLNVYKIENFSGIDFTFVWYAIGATLALFVLGLVLVLVLFRENDKRGVLLQATFRANFALIGIPLATSLFGETGEMTATVLVAFIVPLFNLLADYDRHAFAGALSASRYHSSGQQNGSGQRCQHRKNPEDIVSIEIHGVIRGGMARLSLW